MAAPTNTMQPVAQEPNNPPAPPPAPNPGLRPGADKTNWVAPWWPNDVPIVAPAQDHNFELPDGERDYCPHPNQLLH